MRAQCSKFEIPIFQGSAVVLQHLHLPAAVAQFSTSSLSLPPAEDAMSTVNLADLYCKVKFAVWQKFIFEGCMLLQ